jgi:hypothetical protein
VRHQERERWVEPCAAAVAVQHPTPGCLRISGEVLLGLGFLSKLSWWFFFLLLHFISRACARDKLKRRYLGLLSVRYGEVCLDLRFQRGFTKVAVGSTALCRLRSHGEAEPSSQFFFHYKMPLAALVIPDAPPVGGGSRERFLHPSGFIKPDRGSRPRPVPPTASGRAVSSVRASGAPRTGNRRSQVVSRPKPGCSCSFFFRQKLLPCPGSARPRFPPLRPKKTPTNPDRQAWLPSSRPLLCFLPCLFIYL